VNQDDYDKLIAEARKDDRKFKGYTAATREVNGKLVSSLVPNTQGNRGVDWGKQEYVQEVDKLPDPKKRSERERVESLSAKLWAAVQNHQPGEMEVVLKMLQAEAWKQGQPVTYEDVKQLAIEQMKLAAAKAQQK
jgi:hypothetical protein